MNAELLNKLVKAQRSEITEYFIYKNLSLRTKKNNEKRILEKLAEEELAHFNMIKEMTKREIKPSKVKVLLYTLMARLFGLVFTLKLMEMGEETAQEVYREIGKEEIVEKIMKDEKEHELALIDLIDEERLKYAGSIVLGLNDALVELTGALAGLTLALRRTELIAVVAMVTGIAAALSMSASEYLSTKQEGGRNPLRASFYTGVAYIFTVLVLVFPYFVFDNVFLCLGSVVVLSLLVILTFTFYISVARGLSFKMRFLEMACISLSIAIVNFFIGMAIKKVFGVEI